MVYLSLASMHTSILADNIENLLETYEFLPDAVRTAYGADVLMQKTCDDMSKYNSLVQKMHSIKTDQITKMLSGDNGSNNGPNLFRGDK